MQSLYFTLKKQKPEKKIVPFHCIEKFDELWMVLIVQILSYANVSIFRNFICLDVYCVLWKLQPSTVFLKFCEYVIERMEQIRQDFIYVKSTWWTVCTWNHKTKLPKVSLDDLTKFGTLTIQLVQDFSRYLRKTTVPAKSNIDRMFLCRYFDGLFFLSKFRR